MNTEFTDAQGHVYLDGQSEPRLRVVGWFHVLGCPHYMVATVDIGRNLCDCEGKVLLGWTEHWPLPDREPPQSIVIDAATDLEATDG